MVCQVENFYYYFSLIYIFWYGYDVDLSKMKVCGLLCKVIKSFWGSDIREFKVQGYFNYQFTSIDGVVFGIFQGGREERIFGGLVVDIELNVYVLLGRGIELSRLFVCYEDE